MCLGPVMGSPGGVTRLQGTVFLLLLANFNNCLDQTVDCYTGLSKLKLKLAQEKKKKKKPDQIHPQLCVVPKITMPSRGVVHFLNTLLCWLETGILAILSSVSLSKW